MLIDGKKKLKPPKHLTLTRKTR